jgi:hypothetical protein
MQISEVLKHLVSFHNIYHYLNPDQACVIKDALDGKFDKVEKAPAVVKPVAKPEADK